MIEVLLLLIPRLCIQYADHPAQDYRQAHSNLLRVSVKKRPAECLHGMSVFLQTIPEPFLDLEDEHFFHLSIGNFQLIGALRRFSGIRQVTSRKQYAP